MLRWPDRRQVDEAVRHWARREAVHHPELLAAGYFGSYATNDWGVGSDVDVIAVVRTSPEPFETRAASWTTSDLPVPADLLVYTGREFGEALRRGDRFARVLGSEVVWVHGSPPM